MSSFQTRIRSSPEIPWDFEALQQRKQKVNSIHLAQEAEMEEESAGIIAKESFKEGFEGEQWRKLR